MTGAAGAAGAPLSPFPGLASFEKHRTLL